MMPKLKFRNGINGTLDTWTPPATMYNVGGVKRRIESKNPGEAGIIVFDKLGLTLGYEAGNNPVYNAFSGNLSAVQRYIFELHGIKTDKSESKLFEGLVDFSTLEWPDMEKKVSFNVLDKLSALSILSNTTTQRQSIPVATRLGYSGNFGVGISKTNLQGVGECYIIPTYPIIYVNYTATPDRAHPIAHQNLILEKGDTFQHPNIGYTAVNGSSDPGVKEKFLVTDCGFTNFNGVQTTWIKVHPTPPSNFEYDPGTYEYFIPHLGGYTKAYYNEPDICCYGYDGYGRYVVTGFDALLMIKAIINNAWQSVSIINKTGVGEFSLSLDYYKQLLDENPFELHPLDALRMLAASIQCYVFFNKSGELVIQKKNRIQYNTVRTFTPVAKKNGGKKKYFWDKLADAVTVTVKSGKIVNGLTLTGSSTVKVYPGIEPRNELKVEIVAPVDIAFTQDALNTYAFTVASEIFNFYGYRHYAFNLTARLTDDMYEWDLLDLIDLNGERYFILSSDINEVDKSASFELVSVTGYQYELQQARAILSTEKYNSASTIGGSSSTGSGTTIPITTQQPLELIGAVMALNYTDNFKLSDDNKLEAIQDIKKTSTTIEFARMSVGGAPDLIYKFKNYGDEWIVGNQRIDGSQSIGGIGDANFKQKIYGNQKITGNITVDGDIYIGGSINRINVVDLDITDHAIRLNKGGDNTTALDGGMEMLGADNVLLGSLKYNGASWISDINFDLSTGKTYKINNIDVLSSTTLGTSVVNSSLTSLGTLNHDLNLANTKVYKINAVEILSATTLGSTVVNSSLTSIGTLNHDLNIASTKVYRINGTQVLSSTTLGTNVVNSSLTSVGTLTSGIWNATVINGQYLNYDTTNLKVTTNQINTIQDIATTSSPTFTNITLSGKIDQQGTNNSEFGSQSLLPKQSYYGNLGSINKKWLTLHAAELWVETLVAQNTIATIGGRILVGPTTTLTQDCTAGVNYVHVKHNEMNPGDTIYMEANGQVEFMRIDYGPYAETGGYYYFVTRDLDVTGANNWNAGDALFNTGNTGEGFIDLYSIRGIKNAQQSGPTIVGNVRNSTTFNDWSEHWAIGNLNGLYGYTNNTFGVGLGKYASNATNITIDSSNGYRIRNYNDVIAQWDNSGKIILGKLANSSSRLELNNGAINFIYRNASAVDTTKISLDASGNGSFNGSITAAAGVIGGWNINSGNIWNVYEENDHKAYINIYGTATNKTLGLQVTAEDLRSNNSVLVTSVGAYNDNNYTRYGMCVWDPVNNGWLLNIGYGGSGENTVAQISSWSFNKDYLYEGTNVSTTKIAISGTYKSIYARPLGAGDNTKYVMLGQTHNGSAFTGYYGISAIDGNNNWLFRLDDYERQIAGWYFDKEKFYKGSTSAGFALNTSSTRWLANSGKGFEVWDVSSPKFLIGELDSNGNLSNGLDWNKTTAGKLTIKGDIVSSRFTTAADYGSATSGVKVETYEIRIYYSNVQGTFVYNDVTNNGMILYSEENSAILYDSRYNRDGISLKKYSSGYLDCEFKVDLANKYVSIANNNLCRWRGNGNNSSRPASNLRDGDMYWNTEVGRLQIVVNNSWIDEY